jgi:hypothetical protein
LDDSGNTIIPISIIHTSVSSFDVTFATTSSGTVVIGGGEGPQGVQGFQGDQGSSGVVISTQSVPTYSGSPGVIGDIRVANGEYLYIHTGDQWLKSSMTFSTF